MANGSPIMAFLIPAVAGCTLSDVQFTEIGFNRPPH